MAEALPDYVRETLQAWRLWDRGPDWATCLPALRQELVATNARVNLTRLTEPDDFYVKHVLDSLLLLHAYPELLTRRLEVLDLGCGGGFPGLLLALVCPQSHFLEVDSVGKKIACVEGFIRHLGLKNARGLQARGVEMGHRPEHHGHYDLVTARAVGATPKLVLEAAALLRRPGGRLVIYRTPQMIADERAASLQAAATGRMRLLTSAPFELPLAMGARQFLVLETA